MGLKEGSQGLLKAWLLSVLATIDGGSWGGGAHRGLCGGLIGACRAC